MDADPNYVPPHEIWPPTREYILANGKPPPSGKRHDERMRRQHERDEANRARRANAAATR